jgi:hypothetical protein
MSSESRNRMSVDELRETPEFQRLTQKQRLFVATYCGGGLLDGNYDSVLAAHTAYACKSAEVARIMSYSLMQNIRIVAALNRHFGTTPTEEFLVQLDRAIRNKHLSIANLQALRMKCEILGLANRLPTLGAPVGVIPDDVLEAERAEHKAKRKASTKAPKVEPKSIFD